jgi:hypothetical protein
MFLAADKLRKNLESGVRGYVARHTSGTDGARTKKLAEEPKSHRNRTER